MSKKEWTITAAIILAIVAALCIYYVPRSVVRTPKLPEGQISFVECHVRKSNYDGIYIYKVEDAEEAASFLAALQAVEMRYVDRKNSYQVGAVSADVFLHYDNGRGDHIFLSDNGVIRYDNKTYKSTDLAALEQMLIWIQSWEQIAP